MLKAWFEKVVVDQQHVNDLVFVEVDAANMFFSIVHARLISLVSQRYPELLPVVLYLTQGQFILLFRGECLEEITGGLPIGAAISTLLATLLQEHLLDQLV